MSSSPAVAKFTELEATILRTIELLKTTRSERDNAYKELAASRTEVTRLEREVEQLRKERDLIKNKVESLLENLAALTEGTLV